MLTPSAVIAGTVGTTQEGSDGEETSRGHGAPDTRPERRRAGGGPGDGRRGRVRLALRAGDRGGRLGGGGGGGGDDRVGGGRGHVARGRNLRPAVGGVQAGVHHRRPGGRPERHGRRGVAARLP